MAFFDEHCSATTLRKGEIKKIVFRGEGGAMFSGGEAKPALRRVAA